MKYRLVACGGGRLRPGEAFDKMALPKLPKLTTIFFQAGQEC